MILGPDGREVSVRKPVEREVAVATVRDRWSSYPSSGLTPERLARIFKEADQGDLYRQAELFEEMEEKDAHLSSILQKRKNAVLGLDWDVIAYSDEPHDQAVREFIVEALDRIPALEEAFLDLLDAIGKGYAVSEIMWEVSGGRAWVKELKWRHQKRFTFSEDGRLLLVTDSAPTGEGVPEHKFIVHRYKARSGHPSRQGVLRVCAWMYLFKNYSVKDWVQFAEVYGMPLRLGKYDPSASKEDREALMQAVTQLGSDAAGIISKSTEIQFVEAVKGTANVYEALTRFCNAEMSKAVLGETLTTEVGERGSYAASQTHGQVRQDILEADCKALAETLRRDLIRPLVLFNFGPGARLPWIRFHFEPPEDLERTAKVYAVLVQDIGLPIAAEHIYEKFGVPKPEPGQQIVVPPGIGALPARLLPFRAVPDPQDAVDRLADRCVARALEPVGRMAEEIMRAVERARDLEELREELAELYATLPADEFEDLLARALYAADLYGRWTAIA